MLTLFSVDEMLLLRYVNWSTNFRGLPMKVEIAFFLFKMHELFFICIDVEANVSCCLFQAI